MQVRSALYWFAFASTIVAVAYSYCHNTFGPWSETVCYCSRASTGTVPTTLGATVDGMTVFFRSLHSRTFPPFIEGIRQDYLLIALITASGLLWGVAGLHGHAARRVLALVLIVITLAYAQLDVRENRMIEVWAESDIRDVEYVGFVFKDVERLADLSRRKFWMLGLLMALAGVVLIERLVFIVRSRLAAKRMNSAPLDLRQPD